jgi:hypothetical protein
MRALIVCLVVALVGCVSGKEILGPWDGQYYVDVCVDSVVVDNGRACDATSMMVIAIPNPLYQAPDTTARQ